MREVYGILGAPFSGKTNVGNAFSEFYDNNVAKVVMSELLANDPMTIELLTYHQGRGELVPDDSVFGCIMAYCEGELGDPDVLVIDGMPRTLAQAEEWDKYRGFDALYHLDVSEHEIRKRRDGALLGGERADRPDNDKFDRRYGLFLNNVGPITNHYETLGTLKVINGNTTPELVRQQVIDSLEQRLVRR